MAFYPKWLKSILAFTDGLTPLEFGDKAVLNLLFGRPVPETTPSIQLLAQIGVFLLQDVEGSLQIMILFRQLRHEFQIMLQSVRHIMNLPTHFRQLLFACVCLFGLLLGISIHMSDSGFMIQQHFSVIFQHGLMLRQEALVVCQSLVVLTEGTVKTKQHCSMGNEFLLMIRKTVRHRLQDRKR